MKFIRWRRDVKINKIARKRESKNNGSLTVEFSKMSGEVVNLKISQKIVRIEKMLEKTVKLQKILKKTLEITKWREKSSN